GVTRLDFDAANGLLVDDDPEARLERVETGVLDAVVGSKATEHDLLDAAVAQDPLEVAALEPRVPLGVAIPSHVDHDVDRPAVERRMKLRARTAGHAMSWPRPSLFVEGPVVRRMPVAGGDHQTELVGRRKRIDPLRDLVASGDLESTAASEVVLEVDDDERSTRHSTLSMGATGLRS